VKRKKTPRRSSKARRKKEGEGPCTREEKQFAAKPENSPGGKGEDYCKFHEGNKVSKQAAIERIRTTVKRTFRSKVSSINTSVQGR